MFELISSRQNKKIQDALALKDRKNRKETGLFFFEGRKLLEEALQRNVEIETIFATKKALENTVLIEKAEKKAKIYEVCDSVYEKLSMENAPEGFFTVAKTIDKYHKFATIYNSPKKIKTALFAISVRDPGNLGTILRSAAAFNADLLILSSDCADIYNPKTLRASMGCLFDLPVMVVSDVEKSILALKRHGITVYATALHRESVQLSHLPHEESVCFLIGNEGHGLSEELIDLSDQTVFIEMAPHAESLNASVAASLLLYQRFID